MTSSEAAPQPVSFDGEDVVLRGDRWPADGAGGEVIFLHGGGQTRHSWGAAAQALAAEGWSSTAPEGVKRIGAFMTDHLDGFASLEEVADGVAAYSRRPRRRNLEGRKKNVRLREDGRWYWHWDPAMMRAVPADGPRPGIDTESILALARQVTVPVLVVRGMLSDVVDDAGIAAFLEAVPSARVAEVVDAGHMVAGDDNDVFTSAVRTFLGEIDGAR